jgi:two-component system sensor histidine kinase RegB
MAGEDALAPAGLAFGAGRVRLRTLILLRWLAVAGQTATVMFVSQVLDFPLPFAALMGVIAASAWLNMILMLAFPSTRLMKEWEAALQLAFDVLQLAALVGLSGGTANPFVTLFIAPVAVAATVLRPATTAALAGLAFVCVGVLAAWRLPLPWGGPDPLVLPTLYESGLVTATLIGLAFTSVYAWRVAAEEERLAVALAAVQAVLAREQKLSALGGLAAAAAHELGTPLATIQLVAKEMVRELPKESPMAEDAALLVSQAERCRGILRQLSARPEQSDIVHARLPLIGLLEEAAGPHMARGPHIELVVGSADPAAKPPEVRRLPEIIHGLGNLIENAAGFAATRVEVIARWSDVEIEITVRDDGPGFPPGVLARLGEPYVSERAPGSRGGGLGLGFFIAKTLMERTGARFEFRNRAPPATGAVIRAVWARMAIEAPPLV